MIDDDFDVPMKPEVKPKRLVQAVVDTETVEFLIEKGVDIPALIRMACAKAAEKKRKESA